MTDYKIEKPVTSRLYSVSIISNGGRQDIRATLDFDRFGKCHIRSEDCDKAFGRHSIGSKRVVNIL